MNDAKPSHPSAIGPERSNMKLRFDNARVLMYSHDTFGLGHLRRCRTIAHSLVENFRGLTVLIISGASIAGNFDYRARVDFMKIPSVIKLRNGEYTSLASHIDVRDTLEMRRSIILNAAQSFKPHIFITDKEPMGLRGELEETLAYLKSRKTRLVLGLREVMDAPHLLDAEWKRSGVMEKIDRYYDDIWVYGPPDFYDPLTGLDAPKAVRDKMKFVGYLKRSAANTDLMMNQPKGDYILVTTGGGGDGADLVADVLAAYRADPDLPHKALVVLGPYMPSEQRQTFLTEAEKIPQIQVICFDARLEELMAGARAVVAMGGYNTFCEIMSFDKPALIIPRTVPREEQLIRARRGAELGLVDMLLPEEARDPVLLAQALRTLPDRAPPSKRGALQNMEGLAEISGIVWNWVEEPETQAAQLVR
jgi:predicted glycosyltransferase